MFRFISNILRFYTITICLPIAQGAVGEKATFPDFNENAYIHGPKITANDLKGRVVFFEYWGINCPPCLAAMPHLQELQKKYGSQGFTVVASHCQLPSPKVKEYLQQQKITFPVYQFLRIPEAPCSGGLPYSVLIGANGKVVAAGFPSELYDKVGKEVRKVTDDTPILAELELKKYKALSKTLHSNASNIEAKITQLRQKEGDEEAAAICNAYDEWLSVEKTRIANLCETNPLQALNAITCLKKAVPSITEFDEQLAEFQQDPALKKLSEIRKKIDSLQKIKEKGRKINPSSIKSLKQTLDKTQNLEKPYLRSMGSLLLQELENLSGE